MRNDRWASHTDPDRWTSIRCRGTSIRDRRPEPGELYGLRYGAWRVVEVRDVHEANWDDDDRRAVRVAAPAYRAVVSPYAVVLDLVCGPSLFAGRRRVHLPGHRVEWVLLGERYAVCSCHSHPWPCLDADRDRVAGMQAAAMDVDLAKAMPGVCPACGEPITARQKTVVYPGENLTVPGGPEPRFHLRNGCRGEAEEYELRWIAVDPRRERILTWPCCPGSLVVHGDGSSECRGGVHDCAGHLTHDHGPKSACFSTYVASCPRGCPREGHACTRTTPRPPRGRTDPAIPDTPGRWAGDR